MIYARHSVLKRGCSIWDRSRMPKEEFDARMKEVRRKMAELKIAAVVIYGDTWSYADLCYLTNYFPKVRGALAVVPLVGEVSILVNIGSRDVPFAKSLTWVEDLRASSQLGKDCAGVLKSLRLDDAKIALADQERGLPLPQWEELKNGVPAAHWEDGSSILSAMRSKKSEREVAVLEEGGRLLAQICEASCEVVRRGRKEFEIAAEIDRLARLKGAEDIRLLMGDKGLGPPGGKEVAKDQSHLALYLAIQYDRYWVEIGRTFVLSKDNKINDIYKKAQLIVKYMSAALAPAKSTAEVVAIAREQLGEHYAAATMYGLGNGIGLSQWEFPFIAEEPEYSMEYNFTAASLEKDIPVALRVGFEADGVFVLSGDSYRITSDGARALTA